MYVPYCTYVSVEIRWQSCLDPCSRHPILNEWAQKPVLFLSQKAASPTHSAGKQLSLSHFSRPANQSLLKGKT